MATTSVGLSQRIAPRLLRPFSRSGSSGKLQELSSHLYQGTGSGRCGVSQLSTRSSPLARQIWLPEGAYSAYRAFSASFLALLNVLKGGFSRLSRFSRIIFLSCWVTGKPLPATTHAGCVATSVYPLGIRVSGHDFRGHGKIHVLYQGTTFSRAIND
jgi:hypothetical protein